MSSWTPAAGAFYCLSSIKTAPQISIVGPTAREFNCSKDSRDSTAAVMLDTLQLRFCLNFRACIRGRRKQQLSPPHGLHLSDCHGVGRGPMASFWAKFLGDFPFTNSPCSSARRQDATQFMDRIKFCVIVLFICTGHIQPHYCCPMDQNSLVNPQ